MKILKAIIFSLLAAPVSASPRDKSMCLYENLPMTTHEHSSVVSKGELLVEVTSNLQFPVRSLAIDFTVVSDAVGSRVEQSVVVPLPAPLQPGETRKFVAYLNISDEQRAKLIGNGEISASAVIANVLDLNEHRFILRENLGPSFRVFWPTQPQSTEVCQRGA